MKKHIADEAGFEKIRVAAFNFKPWKWHKDHNVDLCERYFKEAAKRGARLCVTTEGVVEGYVANDAIVYPELIERMFDIAESSAGPTVKRFQALAKKFKMGLVFGLLRKVKDKGLFNTVMCVDHSGKICGIYDKMQFAEGYDKSWNFNRLGDKIRAFDTPYGRMGMVICNDRWNPAITRTLALDGAKILCIPTYGASGDDNDRVVLQRARENGICVVQANVGKNLIVSKGEVVASDRDQDVLTLGDIHVPCAVNRENARALEKAFLSKRPSMMRERYGKWMGDVKAKQRKEPQYQEPAKPRVGRMKVKEY